MTDDRFDRDDTLSDAQLAQTVEEALRGLRIASSGKDEERLRSAVAELGRRPAPLLVAPKLAADPNWARPGRPAGDFGAKADPQASFALDGDR